MNLQINYLDPNFPYTTPSVIREYMNYLMDLKPRFQLPSNGSYELSEKYDTSRF